jgi:hypothetical protein
MHIQRLRYVARTWRAFVVRDDRRPYQSRGAVEEDASEAFRGAAQMEQGERVD